MPVSEHVLPGKCVVCYARADLRRYTGRFPWLKASICGACGSRRAEPLSLVLLWISANGGPDACADVAAGWVSYSPPDYLGWQDIRQAYADEIQAMLAVVETELGPEFAQALRTGRPTQHH